MQENYFLEKPLPNSIETERILLGLILLDPTFLNEVRNHIEASYFYNPRHKRVYNAMLELQDSGKSVDVILIFEIFQKSAEGLNGITIPDITNLTFGVPLLSISTALNYCSILKEKWIRRRLVHKANSIALKALEEADPLDELLSYAETEIYAESETYNSSLSSDIQITLDSAINDSILRAQTTAASNSVMLGIGTGFIDIDQKLLGLEKASFTIIAARPSMGKTSLVTNIAVNVTKAGHSCLFLSLEMSKKILMDRIIASETGINMQKYRTGSLTASEWEKVYTTRDELKHCNLVIDDTPAIGPQYLRYAIRRAIKKLGKPLDLGIIDYIQLMEADDGSTNRQQQISTISRQLAAIGKEFDMPLIALSQLSRAPEGRVSTNFRPVMSDLRESGAIEQDADTVAFVYREDQYKKNPSDIDTNEAEILISKNRNGPTGVVKLFFDKPIMKFKDIMLDF